ncbi:MAG: adenylyltransferase/cytidyltransferase family protein [Candidatus Nanoarchaeia archaeon]|nr:adenylyltransferase/cytidyltransferase family protein [Candidatus Nanoarchaeia archaeon]MDD5587604.1 adenylyltransferase/cytidyltransferase family protein [Candidatus Nanoarchaeia archaeon]
MKKQVWENKSNGQLCITIPKNSGIKVGDVVNVEKEKIRKIVYSPITADMFHYGHLRALESANLLGDFHICGVLTDEAIKSYKEEPIADLKERVAIISGLRCVDVVITQQEIDPTENLKKIYGQYGKPKIILISAPKWKKVPGSAFIKKIGGEVVQLPFYSKLSKEKIISKIFKIHKDGKVKNYG